MDGAPKWMVYEGQSYYFFRRDVPYSMQNYVQLYLTLRYRRSTRWCPPVNFVGLWHLHEIYPDMSTGLP